MVSGGQVRSDASSISTSCSNYTSVVEGLSSSWKGSSYDNLNSRSQEVSSEALSTLKSEMEAFASACDLYEEYESYKQQLSVAQSNYNQAVSQNDSSAISTYSNQVNSYTNKLNSLKEQILSQLSAATSGKIEASRLSGSTGTGAVSSIIQSAIDWAVAVAADDSHGYSQKTRWGNPNYDCSSLVISAYEAAGISVKEAGAGYTGNMRSAFTKVGFEWIPGNPDVNSLQPGDVLLNEGQHTEMYIGDGMNVGAHGDRDGVDGDSSGKEINISNYHSYPWDGVLRYVGYDSAESTLKV